ncbi:MAG: hypothetical protein JXQ90_19145 [Cyclobacteriaceae bacterium]
MEKEYKNIGFVFLLLIPMALWAFYKSYIIQLPDIGVTIDGYIHLHAAVSSVWLALLISQPLLIRYHQFRVHRILGQVSYIVFLLLVLTFVPLIVRNYNGITSVINPLFDFGLLLIFYPLAILNKKNIAVHMRYMIAITLIFIGPTLARILFHWTSISGFWGTMITWGSINVILVGLLIWDKRNGRPYQPYVVALGAFFTYLIVLFILNY